MPIPMVNSGPPITKGVGEPGTQVLYSVTEEDTNWKRQRLAEDLDLTPFPSRPISLPLPQAFPCWNRPPSPLHCRGWDHCPSTPPLFHRYRTDMHRTAALCFLALVFAPIAQAQSPPEAETQIAAAVKAAPAPMRDAATVRGYAADGTVRTLREGTGSLVCLADDPEAQGFKVACYHESLAPFMQRGRELRRQGVAAVDSVRRAEIDAGTLAYPDHPAALYNLSGSYDAASDTVRNASRLHVVYVPYQTAESTGLPTRPQGGPWLMEPGQPWAHIMITNP